MRLRARLTLPNLLSATRLALVPILLFLAWLGYPGLFLTLVGLAFVTDALDGLAARRLQLESSFGAKLDSWSDVAIYATLPVGALWLWPDIVRQEAAFILVVILSFAVPALVGMVKFGGFTSYHTWGVKLAAVLMAPAVILLFAGGPAWPFRWATLICVVAATEEVLISLLMRRQAYNVPSLWHVLQERRRRRRVNHPR